jgi:hypothetical protein
VLKDPAYGPVFGSLAATHTSLFAAWLLDATEALCDVTLRPDPALLRALGPATASDGGARHGEFGSDDSGSDGSGDDDDDRGGRSRSGEATRGLSARLAQRAFLDVPPPLPPALAGPAFVLACAALAQRLSAAVAVPADALLDRSGCLDRSYSRGGGGHGGGGHGGLAGDGALARRAAACAARLATFHAEAVGGALGLALASGLHAPPPVASGAGGYAAHTSACGVRPAFVAVARALDAAALEVTAGGRLFGGGGRQAAALPIKSVTRFSFFLLLSLRSVYS